MLVMVMAAAQLYTWCGVEVMSQECSLPEVTQFCHSDRYPNVHSTSDDYSEPAWVIPFLLSMKGQVTCKLFWPIRYGEQCGGRGGQKVLGNNSLAFQEGRGGSGSPSLF